MGYKEGRVREGGGKGEEKRKGREEKGREGRKRKGGGKKGKQRGRDLPDQYQTASYARETGIR